MSKSSNAIDLGYEQSKNNHLRKLKELKKKNAGDLILAVSHGIFSHGFEDLLSLYKEVFTTDSFNTVKQEENVKQIKLSEILKL